MSPFTSIQAFFGKLFRRSQLDSELSSELRSHIDHRADDLERTGLTRREAERVARTEFGSQVRYQQESHEALGAAAIESFYFDLRYALRMVRKAPGFTITAVITLALAIAANAIVFSFARGLVLRPLNVPQPSNLYMIELGQDRSPQQSYPDYLDIRDRNRTFEGVVAASIAPVGFDSDGKAVTTWTNEVSGNYFDTIGVQPYLGRMLHASDEHGPNSCPYIVLSYGFWKSHFHADPAAIGRTVRVNKHPYTILGVAPEGFRGTEVFFNAEFWAPLVNQEQIEGYSQLKDRGSRGLWIIARKKPGIKLAQAATDLAAIAQYLAATYPKEDGNAIFTMARSGLMGDFFGGPVRAFLAGLALLAALILLAACANLGSLFAARASDRAREIALRLALGSSRRRILRQLLAEAILIAFTGGVVGITISVVLLRLLSTLQPVPNFPVSLPVNPDWQVYIGALALAVFSGVLFGLVPIRQVLGANPWQVVKSGASAAIGRRFSTRDILLILQIVICGVLVTASLVAVRGLIRSLRANFGFEPEQTYLLNTDLDMAGYKDAHAVEMQKRLIDTYKTLPGVSAAGLIDRPPLSLGWSNDSVFRDDATEFTLSHAATDALAYSISPEYFQAAGTRLVAGRAFTLHDDAESPAVAIINRELARRIFGTEDRAVGGFLKLSAGKRLQVVGIVEDGKYKTVTEDPQPAIFRPILQAPTTATWIVIRSNRDYASLAPLLDNTMRSLDPELPFTLISWTKQLNGALFPSRVATIALGSLGILGAMLAATGIFGMASYSVSRRLRELGIRIALGAQRRELLAAAIGRALQLLVWGSLAGLLLGLASTRVLAAIVYQASPNDPLVLSGVILAMLLLGLIATWIPARRALSIDPLTLLREE